MEREIDLKIDARFDGNHWAVYANKTILIKFKDKLPAEWFAMCLKRCLTKIASAVSAEMEK